MCSVFREEFTLAKFGLSHHKQSDFISDQWSWNPSVFFVYRLIVAAYVTGFFIATVILSSQDGHADFLAYLTIWTYFMLTLYFLFSAIAVFFYRCFGYENPQLRQESTRVAKLKTSRNVTEGYNNPVFLETGANWSKLDNTQLKKCYSHEITENSRVEILAEDITLFMKIIWLLGNTVQVFAIIVSVVYFTAIFPSKGHTSFIDINLHGINSLCVIVDTCLSARPVCLLHVIYPLIYGACYLIFSAVYWSFDHVNHVIYPGVLDWNNPGTATVWVTCLTFIVIPLLQLIYFGAYQLKLHISRSNK